MLKSDLKAARRREAELAEEATRQRLEREAEPARLDCLRAVKRREVACDTTDETVLLLRDRGYLMAPRAHRPGQTFALSPLGWAALRDGRL